MGTIVVGVDGSPSAVNAVRWAAAEAASRDETVRLVHAYEVPRHGYPDFVTTFARLREGMRHQGAQWLKEARAAAEETAPGVAVEPERGANETVRLVHAYEVPRHGYPDFVTTFARLREGMRHQGEQWLKEARAAAEETAPGVAVETELVENEPVTVLIDRSRRCRLVVLGSR